MIRLSRDIFNKILEHARGSYPHECCGVLVGSVAGGKRVLDACPTDNLNRERANDRYEIDPAQLLRIEKDTRAKGLEVLGFYHSHPDHPPRPSEFDRERGWPEYSYIIVSVRNGVDTVLKSWTFTEDDEPFGEEEVVVED